MHWGPWTISRVVIALAVILVGGLAAAYILHPALFAFRDPYEDHADRIVAQCRDAPYRPACYDEEIPKLMDSLSMEEAFRVAQIVIEKDQSYLHCHVLGHKLAGREVDKNPTAWKDVITRCPTTVCNNGCIHGPLLKRFNKEVLTEPEIAALLPDLKDVCEPRGSWHPREVERSMCYHALGHLHMFVTGANIRRSVELCNAVGTKPDGRDYFQTCVEGVFMQVYQPLEPEDYALVKNIAPARNQVHSFCAPYRGEAFHACHREAWPLFNQEIKQPDGLMKFCSYSDDAVGRDKCFAAVMNTVTVAKVTDNNNRLDTLKAFCNALLGEFLDKCYANAARRLIQIDPRLYQKKALEVCALAEITDGSGLCYDYLTSFAKESFEVGSPDHRNYCAGLPEPWRTSCLRV